MEEGQKEDESTKISPIDIFVCYAHEDEEYRQRLEKHLSLFQREGLIHVWHDGKISPGKEWEQIIHTQLDRAQIVLLLISPDFIASEYCYTVEMRKALERHAQGEVHVIPVIVRPIGWQKTPLGALQALPKNAKPIALWRNRDAAFFDVEEGIRSLIEEVKTQSPLSPSSLGPKESGKNSQKASFMEEVFIPEPLMGKHETDQESTTLTPSEGLLQKFIPQPSIALEEDPLSFDKHIISLPRNKNSRKRRLLVSITIILILVVFLLPFFLRPACSFSFCSSSPQPTKQASPQNEEEVQDQNLSVNLVAIMSPSFVFPDDSKRSSDSTLPPTDISAVLLPQNTSTYDTIIINVQNLRYGGADIFIDSIALKLLSIPALPRPLRVWTPGVTTTYLGYPYPVTYKSQQQGQLLYAEPPPKPTILKPAGPNRIGESDKLSLQIMSTVTAYLRFRIEVTYQIIGSPEHILVLPKIFQVVFSDSSNWQEESL